MDRVFRRTEKLCREGLDLPRHPLAIFLKSGNVEFPQVHFLEAVAIMLVQVFACINIDIARHILVMIFDRLPDMACRVTEIAHCVAMEEATWFQARMFNQITHNGADCLAGARAAGRGSRLHSCILRAVGEERS